MKRISLVLLAVVTFFSCSGCSCSEQKKPNENNNVYNELKLDYMKDFMIDVSDVAGYAIKYEYFDSTKQVVKVKKDNEIELLSARVLSDSQEDKEETPYLYTTSEDGVYGNVEYDLEDIEKVVFLKSAKTYEINDNLEDLIIQDNLDAKINKVYTAGKYTFLQFIAKVEESGSYPYEDSNGEIHYENVYVRPTKLVYDEKGVSEFDKKDYFTSKLTASFVIDNDTGLIYKIENIYIKEFKNGLVIDNNGYYYRMNVDLNGNLTFTDILVNKDVTIYSAAYDNYGWTYICNSQFEYKDEASKTILFKKDNDYIVDANNNVYRFIEDSYYIVIEEFPNGGKTVTSRDKHYISYKMEDGESKVYQNQGFIKEVKKIDENEDEIIFSATYNDYYISDLGVYHKRNGTEVNKFNDDVYDLTLNGVWLDDNYDMAIKLDQGKLYYKHINIDDYLNTNTRLLQSDYTLMHSDIENLEVHDKDYYLEVANDKVKITHVYKVIGLNETKYYRIVRENDVLTLKEVEAISYSQNIYIFQPINK